MYEYDLFAVINHEGQINNGHYTNFARYCDEVSVSALNSPSYLLSCSGIDSMTISTSDRMSFFEQSKTDIEFILPHYKTV